MSLDLGQDAVRVPTPREIIVVGLGLTALAVAAQAASQVIDFRVFHLGMRVLDSNHHASLFGAASLLAQAAAAAAIVLRAAASSRTRRGWVLVGILVGALVIVRTFVGYSTEALLPPLAAVFVAICWLTSREPPAIRVLVWASLALLGGSFALHAVGLNADSTLGYQNQTWGYQATGMLKHGTELAGWMLLATGMAAASIRRFGARPGMSMTKVEVWLGKAGQVVRGTPAGPT
jgi:hypothetical protein